MSKPVLVDTDVLVDYFRGYSPAVSLVQKHAKDMILSSIVVAELYAGIKGPHELSLLDEFVSLFRVVPVSLELSRSGGLLKNDYGKSHGVGLPDAVIAATALTENATLLTLNVKHYPMIKGMKPAYMKK